MEQNHVSDRLRYMAMFPTRPAELLCTLSRWNQLTLRFGATTPTEADERGCGSPSHISMPFAIGQSLI